MNNNHASSIVFPGLEVSRVPLGKVVAKIFGVTPDVLEVPFSRTRKREVCNARYVYMHYVSKSMKKGPSYTGLHVGRGHADIINACKQYTNHVDTELNYRNLASTVLKEIENGRVILPDVKGKKS